MIELLKYCTSDFWVFLGSSFMLGGLCYYGCNLTIKMWVRFMRFITVALRGWPPEHLDADGDHHKNFPK